MKIHNGEIKDNLPQQVDEYALEHCACQWHFTEYGFPGPISRGRAFRELGEQGTHNLPHSPRESYQWVKEHYENRGKGKAKQLFYEQ